MQRLALLVRSTTVLLGPEVDELWEMCLCWIMGAEPQFLL